MPAYQSPFQSALKKRKSDYDETNLPESKRKALAESSGARSYAGSYWQVQWRNLQFKKHKSWDHEGILVVRNNWCELLDGDNGHRITCGKPSGVEGPNIAEDTEFVLGNKDIRVDYPIKASDFLSGSCFSSGASIKRSDTISSPAIPVPQSSVAAVKPYVPLRPKNGPTLGFKAPSFVRPPTETAANSSPGTSRIDQNEPQASTSVAPKPNDGRKSFWYVNWRKPQSKKHKTWEGDAYIMRKGDTLTMINDKGLIMGTRRWDGVSLQPGYATRIGNREIEILHEVSASEMPAISGSSAEYDNDLELGSPPLTQDDPVPFIDARKRDSSPEVEVISAPAPVTPSSTSAAKKYVPPATFYQKPKAKPGKPLHDPDAEGAVVMPVPSESHQKKWNKRDAPVVPVVVDPILARKLRPHQIEGVRFMYECVMAMRGHDGKGCILADEMGMGKTLQTITLIWTLLKQNTYANIGPTIGKAMIVCPVSLINNWKNEFHKWLGRDRVGIFVGDKDKNVIKQFVNSRIHHVLIIGYEKLRTVISELKYCIPPIGLIICDEGHRLKSANNKTSTMFEELSTPRRIILSGTPIQNDLGEFHAMADFCNPGLLGNYNNFKKIYETPILKSRAPGCSAKEKEIGEGRLQQLLETAKSFVLRRDATILKNYLPPKYEYVVFITPTQLQRDIFHKILTADKLDNLVRNSTAESLALIGMLTKISNSPILLKAAADKVREQQPGGGDTIKRNVVAEAAKLLPERAQIEDVSLSGKLAALANLLRVLYKGTDEKCIIVSHYTSTLNVIEAFCKKKAYTYLRLDGSTATAKRQDYVNEFNKSSQRQRFIFLLSSKAGGVGLNLIGASRLCLIDSDWNPSHDLQSMARIHRDGQKRPVFIYRFLTAGSIDEKIYQRQVTKLGLSDSLLGKGGSESKSDSFTRKDLRDIFTIHPNTACHTHELLECPCEGTDTLPNFDPKISTSSSPPPDDDEDSEMGFIQASAVRPEHIEKMDKEYLEQKKAQLAALGKWTHINCLRANAVERIQDPILQKLVYVPPESRAMDVEAGGKSRVSSLLAATDLENVLHAMRPPIPVEDLPGGAVSFLFERSSKTPLDDAEEASKDDDDALDI